MPFTTTLERAILGLRFGNAGYSPPATDYIGLICTTQWAKATPVLAGAYVIGSAFASTNRKIYVCTTPGTTGSSEPSWNQGAGATTSDGSVVWTETTALFEAGSFTGAEPTDTNYARVGMVNNGTNWGSPTGSDPASVANAVQQTFGQSAQPWGWVAGFFLSTALTGGTPNAWGLVNVNSQGALAVLSAGIAPNFPIGALTVTLA